MFCFFIYSCILYEIVQKTETTLEIQKKIDNETSILANERAIT